MDRHLLQVHMLKPGTEDYDKIFNLKALLTGGEEEKERLMLTQVLADYRNYMTNPATGSRRSVGTTSIHMTSIRTFLTKFSKDALEELEQCREAGGLVEYLLEEGKIQPESLGTYLHNLSGFITFMASEREWVRHLEMTSNDLETIAGKLLAVAKSLKEDSARRKLERLVTDPVPYL